jgi:hypothetical protein
MANQTVTRTIESDLAPTTIFTTLSNATLIPQWAPVFADSSEHISGPNYRLTKSGRSFDVEALANETTLTVDYLFQMTENKRGGAYIRVIPRPLGGSTVTMTVPLGPDTTEEAVAEVLGQELQTLIKLAQNS